MKISVNKLRKLIKEAISAELMAGKTYTIECPEMDMTIQVQGQPDPELKPWAEAVHCTWPLGLVLETQEEIDDVTVVWSSEYDDWSLMVGDEFYACTISPSLPIPKVYQDYYGVDENGVNWGRRDPLFDDEDTFH